MSQSFPLREQLNALEHVQEVDLKIDNLRKNKGSLPASLRALDDQLARLNATVITKKAAIAEVEKGQKQTTAALDLTRDRLGRSSARLEGVQNSQEYSAASKEIDQLKKQQEILDEQARKSSADIDLIQKELAEVQVGLGKLKSERDAQAATLTGETGKMEEEIAELMKERGKFTPKVEPRLLAQYDRIRAARGGLGIVPAIAGRCKACNMMVPPQQFNELQRASTMHSCPSCNRILFVPGPKTEKES